MRFTFKNGITKEPAEKNRITSKLLQQFDEVNLRLQYKCAHWLERKTANWSRKNWMFILVVFTLVTSGCSIYVMVDSFSNPRVSSIPITPFVKPTNTIQTHEKMDQLKVVISKGEYEKLIRFRRHMDSLGHSPTGKK